MKALKSKRNKIDRGHDIHNNDEDCNHVNADEENSDWINGVTKEVDTFLKWNFGEFCPKDWVLPEVHNLCSLCARYELKNDLRKNKDLKQE